jgi:hypothetical protein
MKMQLPPIINGPHPYLCQSEKNTEHLFQTIKLHQAQREKIWNKPTSIAEKLYGPVEDLQKTARFVEETGIQV